MAHKQVSDALGTLATYLPFLRKPSNQAYYSKRFVRDVYNETLALKVRIGDTSPTPLPTGGK